MYITSYGFTGIESHIILMYLVPLVALWLLYYGQREIAELQLLDNGPMWTVHATATRKLYYMRLDDNSVNAGIYIPGSTSTKGKSNDWR
jgi:hypothetical protein